MFDIGWSEMAIIAVVTLVVLGPKELPHALKMFSHWMRAARKLGSEFQSGVNEIVREAELDDAKRELQKLSKQSIGQKIEKAIDPTGDLKKAINAPLDETKTALSTPSEPVAPGPAPEPSERLPSLAVIPPGPDPQPAQSNSPAELPANADAAPASGTPSDKSLSA
jgi:sec-independent protein translocase protein TatB